MLMERLYMSITFVFIRCLINKGFIKEAWICGRRAYRPTQQLFYR
jgi:hypothetical protein